MNVRDLIARARSGDDYACGALYAICEGDPVKLTELGEDIATAVSDAHDRAIARTGFRPTRKEPTNDAWREYARLTQARLDRNADPTDYDREWTRNVVALNPHSEEFRRLSRVLADVTVVDTFADGKSRAANADMPATGE